MSHYVTEACIKCKYQDCVAVCPVDCFYEGPNFLVINPEECIDCGICIPECPVEAIVDELTLKSNPQYEPWVEINKRLSEKWALNNIVEVGEVPADADEWAKVKDKKHLLEEE